MAHTHARSRAPAPSRHRGLVVGLTLVIAVATLAGVVWLWPSHDPRSQVLSKLRLPKDIYGAHVVRVTNQACTGTEAASVRVRCAKVRFRLDQGPDKGRVRTIELPRSATAPHLAAGDGIVLTYQPDADPGFRYTYADRQRRPVLLVLTILFGVAVILLGRLRGFFALVGLGASIVVILQFVLPAILDGQSPVLVALVGASAIAFLALYLASGLSTMTTVALLGTLAALALTAGLAEVFSSAAHLTGLASEDALLVKIAADGLDLRGLVIAGMVLGALGALDDVTVTQASAVWELRAARPDMPRRQLFSAGLRIGRDHFASTVNTLALAYAGASLPLLILFVLSKQSLGTVSNSEVVAVEIIATLVGSIGLVTAVPITTWLAAELAPATPTAHAVGADISDDLDSTESTDIDSVEITHMSDRTGDRRAARAPAVRRDRSKRGTNPDDPERDFWRW